MLKRAVCMLTTVCLLAICLSCFVTAETSWNAVLKVEQTSAENNDGIITVRVSVSRITSETGIICAIYNLYYDTKCLELVSWKNGTPANWDFSENSLLYANDWSCIINENGEPYFYYTLFNETAQDGVKDDDVLYTDLQFKVLDDAATTTDIKVTDIAFIDANDLSKGTSLDLADKTLTLELSGAGGGNTSTDVSEDSSSAESSEEETSNTVSTPAGDVSGEISEEISGSNLVTVDITLRDIKDSAGVASLLFHVKYDDKKLTFVNYECIKPSDWRDNTRDYENLTPADQVAGDLLFWILNADETCSVTEDDALGFRLTFEVISGSFETSWLTIDEVEVVEIANGEFQEMGEGSYSLTVTQVGGNGSIADPDGDDGRVLKIVIAVIAAVLVVSGAVAIWYFVRKKKSI